ncbi:hypothetical protein L6164_019035 [Bauhinia variegata]|uniref:Uncharacterized protein n=1 Tax=Bauhinia variegata TaxID=167791 RepID=A0ACB9NDK8_BAUVA|nr:hypothetical protein L6164_019035 [Bauhinia variegata]
MEACTANGTDEFVGSSANIDDAAQILVKGKRTKRQRPLSPSTPSALAVAANTIVSTSSSSSASEEDRTRVIGGGDSGSFSSTPTTNHGTEEEEDMANCLILLARGDAPHPHQLQQRGTGCNGGRIRFGEMATAKMGFYIYECKTCNRTFPSFQALGGHRASHKKPKVSSLSPYPSPEEKKPPPLTLPRQNNYDFQEAAHEQSPLTHTKTGPPQIPLHPLPSNRSGFKAPKIHECSICGSEFTSGQALGGHMRRHRASARTSSDQVAASCDTSTAVNIQVKPGNILELDLNLPAPEDDLRESKFEFTATQKALVLSAPTLVDCHY